MLFVLQEGGRGAKNIKYSFQYMSGGDNDQGHSTGTENSSSLIEKCLKGNLGFFLSYLLSMILQSLKLNDVCTLMLIP